jgi:hypothetical protein
VPGRFCYPRILAIAPHWGESNSTFFRAVFLSGGDIAVAVTPSARHCAAGVAEAPRHA